MTSTPQNGPHLWKCACISYYISGPRTSLHIFDHIHYKNIIFRKWGGVEGRSSDLAQPSFPIFETFSELSHILKSMSLKGYLFCSPKFKKVLVYLTVLMWGLQNLCPQEYNYHDFHTPMLEDPDFEAKPLVMVMGQYSTGKTTFIRFIVYIWNDCLSLDNSCLISDTSWKRTSLAWELAQNQQQTPST